MLRRIIKITLFISSFLLFTQVIKEYKIIKHVNKVINKEISIKPYNGFINIPKFNYNNIIKNTEDSLDNNYVFIPPFSDEIGGNNVILAGHNNMYVFNKIYYLDIDDEIIISDFNVDYLYKVIGTKYIEVDDYDSLKVDNSLILITCSNNNQKRYIVISKRR